MWAIVAAAVISPVLTALLGRFLQVRLKHQDEKIQEVHVLVNSQLSQALSQIDRLKTTIHELTEAKE